MRRQNPLDRPNEPGLGGRMSPESLAECDRIQWPNVAGMSGRIRPEYAIKMVIGKKLIILFSIICIVTLFIEFII
jgi:hypothetical protein